MGFLIFHIALDGLFILCCAPWIFWGLTQGKTYAVYHGVVYLKEKPFAFIQGFLSNLAISIGAGYFIYNDVMKILHMYNLI